MNYPIWEIPSGGLLIATVAILHVFVSHFAVGGGLFLVLAERKAYRDDDPALLDYVRGLSRFFILLTLVFGAITGVGIWFTIGLVHPQATSSLITIFVWAWAVEWTFFVAEIAAAMVYYYGWDRLDRRTHLVVGWIYFVAAWMSLVVINGILSFMLTPGAWPSTHDVWDGFLNPTYVPSLVARTFVAVGLAGLYAMLVVSWRDDAALRAKVGRYAGAYWVLPTAIGIPVSLAWYLAAAAGAGVPVVEVFGATGHDAWSITWAVVTGSPTGQPVAQGAALAVLVSSLVVLGLTIVLVTRRRVGAATTAALMIAGLISMGGGEWVREALRKPFIIGQYMFTNGVRLPTRPESPLLPAAAVAVMGTDRFTVEALDRDGVLDATVWARRAAEGSDEVERRTLEGRELFKLECAVCHTEHGYMGIAPLVAGLSPGAIEQVVARLARPVGANGEDTTWADPAMRLATWRGRQMPPFVGTAEERRALAFSLALVGGASPERLAAASAGERYFEERCGICHGPEADFQIPTFERSVEALEDRLRRLPEINEMMPPFEGTDVERRAVAEYLATRRPPIGGEGSR